MEGQRAYCHHEYHPAGDQEADQWCEYYHQVRMPRIGKKVTMGGDNKNLNEWAASSVGEHEPPGPVIIGPRPWETKEDEE